VNISLDALIQVAAALLSAGGVLWKLSDRLKGLELDQQATAARLEGMIGRIDSHLQAHAARSEERHTATTRRIDDHATELAANRAAHGQMRATIEQQGQQLAALGGRR
jgi:hypothetical protein